MSLTPDEAVQSLAMVDAAERRSREAIHYAKGAPFLITIGLFWMISYAAEQFWPGHEALVWGGGALVFTAIIIAVSYVSRKEDAALGSPRALALNRKLGWLFGLIAPAFIIASIAVLWPLPGLRLGAWFPLLYSSIYTAMGLWMGQRYIIVGVTVFIATLAGFYFVKEYFGLWMAVFGGGSMLLTGLWLRKA